MSVTRNTTITQAAMDALADLANTNLLPLVQTLDPSAPEYEFPKISDLGSASNASGTAQAGTGYVDGSGWLTIRIYAFKSVLGRKEYSPRYTEVGCNLDGSIGGAVDVQWAWDAVPDADGYVLAIITQDGVDVSEVGYWQEVLTNSLLDDFTGWLSATGWDDTTTFPYNPVTTGSWWRVLQRMRRDIETVVDNALAGPKDLTWLVSGPHCVSVGPILRYGNLGPVYKDVEFYYAADDHGGDLDVETIVEIGTPDEPFQIASTAGAGANYKGTLQFNLAAAGELRASLTIRQTGTGTGWTHSLTLISGTATINSETWTETSSTLTLEFTASLSAPGWIRFEILATAAAGNIASPNPSNLFSETVVGTETLTPTDADVIHPTSLGKKVAVTDLDTALGPIEFAEEFVNHGFFYPGHRAKDSVEGVWAALCLPVFGVHTYLESDLPNYTIQHPTRPSGFAAALPRLSAPEAVVEDPASVTPSVRGCPSLWPVFNDEEAGAMRYIQTSDLAGSLAQYPTPWFISPFQTFSEEEITLAAGATVQRTASPLVNLMPSLTYERLKIETLDAPLAVIYVSQSQPPNPNDGSTYDLAVAGLADLPSDFAVTPDAVFYYAVKNLTDAPITTRLRLSQFQTLGVTPPAQVPQFFLLGNDGERGYEHYSYNLSYPASRLFSIPLSGYCITELKVVRQPVAGVIPSTGEPALGFDIGLRHGVTADNAGTYVSLYSGSIGADLPAETVPVFIPVLAGAALFYQANEPVEVYAAVNFMPQMIAKLHPESQTAGTLNSLRGTFCGEPYLTSRLLRFQNATTGSDGSNKITLPICALAYNDLEATLNLL